MTHPPGGHDAVAERTSAEAIAAAVREGRTCALDVLEQHLERVTEANPHLNALVALRTDEARADAAAVDKAVRAGRAVGPLAGVPFTVKDVVATSDLPTTCGSRLLAGHRTRLDATAVARLRGAGAVLVGKSNCPEFAFGIDTANDLHGRTRNPLGDLTPGGSSGGESAAVAAGMTALGVGTDFGGSVRWPAQCTGVVGLRPTIGRVPTTGHLPGITDDEPVAPSPRSVQGRFQSIGLLAASVRDVALGLEVMCGPDGVDPFAAPVPLGDPGAVQLSRVEVRHGCELAGAPVAPAVADAVAWASDVLAVHGARLAGALPPQLGAAVGLYSELRRTDPLDEIRRIAGDRTDELTPMIRGLLAAVPDVPEHRLVRLWADRDRLVGELLAWLRGDRLLLLPVSAGLPLRGVEVEGPLDPSQLDLLAPSRAVTLFGLPALSVPCPVASDGRPVSVQVVGPPFREDLVLAAGLVLESRQRETV
jgi:amidase